jgi:hypothetical protein
MKEQSKMGRKEKPLARLKQRPKDFTWEELTSLLKALGYVQRKTGRTGSSRRRFVHPAAPAITLHKPHPDRNVKMYVIHDMLEFLEKEGLI